MFTNLCVYGKCENLIGMFRCECNPGYQADNTGGKDYVPDFHVSSFH